MYKRNNVTSTNIKQNESYVGETIEQKIERIVNNNEPIKDGAPLIYTERKHGVQPQYDIRTDRFDIAVDAMDKVAKTYQAKREEGIKQRDESKVIEMKNNKKNGETQANTSDNINQ